MRQHCSVDAQALRHKVGQLREAPLLMLVSASLRARSREFHRVLQRLFLELPDEGIYEQLRALKP
jgi:hypothetical protein